MNLHLDDQQILTDRVATAVDNIISGDNACGTLQNAAAKGDRTYFEQMIRPVMQTYAEEAAELRRQRDATLRDNEAKRFALESVAANIAAADIPPGTKDAIAKALPGRL